MALRHAYAGVLVVLAGTYAKECAPLVLPNSNRTASAPCTGDEGSSCQFECSPGFTPVGSRLVCQNYTTKSGVNVLNREFWGARCERLCSGTAPGCDQGQVPVRWNSTDANGPCFAMKCHTESDALEKLTVGSWQPWRLVRHPKTGIYAGTSDNTVGPEGQSDRAHIGINGVGLMFECVADAMGWQTRSEAQERVKVTLSALAGELPGFKLARQESDGWIPTFFNRSTGAALGRGPQVYTTLDTGLNSAGCLFAKTYFTSTSAAKDTTPEEIAATAEIARLATKVFHLVNFTNLLCTPNGKVAPNGVNGVAIPFTFQDDGTCGALHFPRDDGYYDYSELHYTVWLSYHQTCGNVPLGKCGNPSIEKMWTKWQGRRMSPDVNWTDTTTGKTYDLLSMWSSYIVQLPFYATHSFNSDPYWTQLFANHFAADLAYYRGNAFFAGDRGRFGIAAGFTDRWCSAKNSGYEADMLVQSGSRQDTPGAQGCKIYSPYAIAGYLPSSPSFVKGQLLDLLADGESVLPVEGGFILLRKSLIEPEWNQNNQVSMVDFASELFGLSAMALSTDFWVNNTNHAWTE